MSEHVGAITPNALTLLGNSGVDTERALKQMFILFEKLVYLPQSSDSEGIGAQLIAEYASSGRWDKKDLLSQKAFTSTIVEAEDVWSEKKLMRFLLETILLSREANNRLEEALDRRYSALSNQPIPGTEMLPEEFRSARGMVKRTLMSSFLRTDIAFAELVRKKFRFGGGVLSESHKQVIEIFANTELLPDVMPQGHVSGSNITPTGVLDGFTMPDFGALSWGEIFDLRRDRFVKDFRAKMAETMHLAGSDSAKNVDLEAQAGAELWRLAEDLQPPRLAVRLGKIALSFLHVPPFEWINPLIHGVLGMEELVEDSSRRRKFGWLYFLANARKTLRENGDS